MLRHLLTPQAHKPLLKHSPVQVWEVHILEVIFLEEDLSAENGIGKQPVKCHSIPAALQSAGFLNVGPRCRKNKDHIKVVLITRAVALRKMQKSLGG